MKPIRTISQLAKELDLNLETIRFYERKGLIQQPAKPPQGYRHYSDSLLNQIRFIKRAQELGFTLNEVQNLLQLDQQPCHQVQVLTEHKLAVVQQKMADLQHLESALSQLLTECKNNDDPDGCPIIHSLQP